MRISTADNTSYRSLPGYDHDFVKHSAGEYLPGAVHTNGVESFWSLLKRGYVGVFHFVSHKHLARYVHSGGLKVLNQAKALGDGEDLVFPGRRLQPLSETTHSLMLRRFGIACVPHGMRSSFRDWCSETGVAREVAEASLAHVVKNKVEAAYARSDLLDQRREVMEAGVNTSRRGVPRLK